MNMQFSIIRVFKYKQTNILHQPRTSANDVSSLSKVKDKEHIFKLRHLRKEQFNAFILYYRRAKYKVARKHVKRNIQVCFEVQINHDEKVISGFYTQDGFFIDVRYLPNFPREFSQSP